MSGLEQELRDLAQLNMKKLLCIRRLVGRVPFETFFVRFAFLRPGRELTTRDSWARTSGISQNPTGGTGVRLLENCFAY